MGALRLITVPIRKVLRFPLFQLAIVLFMILFLQAADDNTIAGRIFAGLDNLTEASVRLLSELFVVKSFTRSALSAGLMIVYVYIVCLLLLALGRACASAIVDFLGWSNAFGLRSTIARDRGIAAYRAWLPLERIRPEDISQEQWEAMYAWPPDNRPPYPPLPQRVAMSFISYLIVIATAVSLIQYFTPFPVLTWFGRTIGIGGESHY